MNDVPEIAVLMATRDGARWLPEQLASIAAQQGVSWRLIASDDGSRDQTVGILNLFAKNFAPGRVTVTRGPCLGAPANFLGLLGAAGPKVPFAALADQDDIWLPGKLYRAVEALSRVVPGVPALYCGRTAICDDGLRVTGLSPTLRRAPSFRNALVQNIAGGNTMVLNRAALTLAQAAAREAGEVAMHDWWLYQIVTGAGGQVIHDDEPFVLYRQHGSNLIGANDGVAARLWRLAEVSRGRLRAWNDVNVAALRRSAHRLTPENRVILHTFAEVKRAPLLRRLRGLSGLGLYRQTPGGRASYWAAAAAGLI